MTNQQGLAARTERAPHSYLQGLARGTDRPFKERHVMRHHACRPLAASEIAMTQEVRRWTT
jgi:hypothetical protein